MPLRRIRKVHELLPDQIVECTLDPKSPFDAARRPALLYPDLVESYTAHAATYNKVVLSRTQNNCSIPRARPISHMHLSYRLRRNGCKLEFEPRHLSLPV